MQPIPFFGEEMSDEWVYEEKIDGWRLQIIKYKGVVEFWGRRLEKIPNWTSKLCKYENFLKDIPDGTLLDSELYSVKGRRGIPSVLVGKLEPMIFIFDIIFLGGKFLGDLELIKRKEILKNFVWEPPFYLHKFYPFQGFEQIKISGISEGIILKKCSSKYRIGKDAPIATSDWRKVKFVTKPKVSP